MKSELKIFNTLSKQKEIFKPIQEGHVGMYVCGPTVYSDVHLGNVRTFISFDIVYRFLKYLGYKVRYVRNITDVGHLVNDADEGEDKIAKQAKLLNLEPMEIVHHYTMHFRQTMKDFNVLTPNIEPTATGHMMEQIDMISKIIENGFAYVSNGSVYFDVLKYSESNDYGSLSGRVLEDLISNTRALDGQEEKRNSLDFALWKKADDSHIMKWKSPWSLGFPGWHLECSAMSTKYLGKTFDIHGGGMDLKFPHHECEIAQSTACDGQAPVNYWMHGNMLTVNGSKMSKSVGNVFTPEQLRTGDHELLGKGFNEMVVRFFILQTHYGSTLDFSNAALEASEKGFERLTNAWHILPSISVSDKSSVDINSAIDKCIAAMCDDFNTPVAIGMLFDLVKTINSVNDGRETLSSADHKELIMFFNTFIGDVLGLKAVENGEEEASGLADDLMKMIIELRTKAKQDKNYALADELRDKLKDSNVVLKDTKEGVTWEVK